MLKTFARGGVHPAEQKISAGEKIEILPVPKTVYIPVSQHLGAPANPLVERGDTVKKGQLIAAAAGFVSANIHSSVSGKVAKVDLLPDQSGYKRRAIVIDSDGDESVPGISTDPAFDPVINYSPSEIIRKVTGAGIVGMGGAAFPTHVKLSIPPGKAIDTLVINGAECEPYLTADHRLMLEKGPEIIVGIRLLMKAMNASHIMIGIENNKPDAISHISGLTATEPDITVHPLKVKYPQGGEKQLIKALTGREVPSGGLPIDVGIIVHNVGTAFAVYEAVQKNKPLIERVVTLTGKMVKSPSNFLVRIGTPVSELIDAAGGLPPGTGKVISGGPMMGKALNSLAVPIVKGTSGILLLPDAESRRKKSLACIRCARCISVCPQGLEPYLLMVLTQRELLDEVETNHVMDCIECGSCAYICPTYRPLLDYIRLGKSAVDQIIKKRKS